MIQRSEYLNKLISWKDRKLIKILTGIRRCGKSTLFQIYQDWLKNNGVEKAQIISLNMEDPAYRDLLNWDKLYDYINANLQQDKMNYVFIDEIQNVHEFQRAADGLFIKDNVDLYLTGSNSHFQSGEWTTLLTGRYIQIHVFPLSFKEYVSAYPFNDTVETKYRHYIENSGFPYSMTISADGKWDSNLIRDYIAGIYDTIVLRDVVENKKIREPAKLERVLKFLADNIGNRVSVKSICDSLSVDKDKEYPQTIENYLDALTDSYILYKADRYDIKGKKLLKTLNKFYLVDLGIRHFILGDRVIDTGKMLENVIYLELLRRNRNVYIGKTNELEVDFVIEGEQGTEYYQVAETVRDPNTLNRELASLESIKDHNPKFLITMDNAPIINHNGIKQIYALDWLLQSE